MVFLSGGMVQVLAERRVRDGAEAGYGGADDPEEEYEERVSFAASEPHAQICS